MSDEQPLVFVVDDDASAREGIEDLLQSVGLQVVTFKSPQEFLEGARPDAPGCIVLDVRLPGTSGLELELAPKLVEMLSELVPRATIIALLVTSNNPVAEHIIIQNAQQAASVKGLELQIVPAGTESEIDAAFATLVRLQAGGLVIQADPLFTSRREQLVALTSRHAVPAISAWREFADAGGLISYGASRIGGWHQIGTYVGKILNGAKPADLPVQQPTRFELVVNLKTAKALGLTVPQSIILRADEVIE